MTLTRRDRKALELAYEHVRAGLVLTTRRRPKRWREESAEYALASVRLALDLGGHVSDDIADAFIRAEDNGYPERLLRARLARDGAAR